MRRSNATGILALATVGGFFLWRNRFQMQRVLESWGIRVPLSTRNLGDTVRSGIAKVTGSIEHAQKEFTSQGPQKIG